MRHPGDEGRMMHRHNRRLVGCGGKRRVQPSQPGGAEFARAAAGDDGIEHHQTHRMIVDGVLHEIGV